MVCINNLFSSPVSSALVCGIIAFFYIITMSYSPYLPPAIILSIIVALFVYALKGGTISCTPKIWEKPVIKTDDSCASRFN